MPDPGSPTSQEDPAGSIAATRKLRNRLSQRAFRSRQSLYIKELEERLRWATKPESDLNANLAETNRQLRQQLLDCHKKLESLQVTLKTISDSVATAVGIERPSSPGPSQSSNEPDQTSLVQIQEAYLSSSETPPHSFVLSKSPQMEKDRRGLTGPELEYLTSQPMPQTQCNTEEDLVDQTTMMETGQQECLSAFQVNTCNSLGLSRLTSLSIQQMMGASQYENILDTGSILLEQQDFQIRRSNSPFSDHITIFEHYLKQKWSQSAGLLDHGDNCLTTSVYFMFSMFVCISWPSMTSWHTYTRAHIPVTKLITWRINPTPETFAKVSRSWQPTQLQLAVPHPAIIDWIPFPALRNKLIICHSGNPSLDEIICTIGNSYVIETDVSHLISGVAPTTGYISVWDLVRAISPEATETSSDAGFPNWNDILSSDYTLDNESVPLSTTDDEQTKDLYNLLPVSTVESLFSSKAAALQAFRFLGMDRGAAFFRLDPAFFERHPELYDHKANLMARGVPLRPSTRRSIPIPRHLDASVLGRYRELASWTINLSLEGAFTAGPSVLM